MKASVLVATPHAPFGELLRISLEDSGQYQVRLARTGQDAREAAGRGGIQLAILDAALNDEPFPLLCHDLIKALPGLRVIVIPPENNPNHPALGGLMPHGYLTRPFYLPDLIETAARLIDDREISMRRSGTQVEAAARADTLPHWLHEPMTLTAYLEKELAGTQALAGVIGLAGTKKSAGPPLPPAGEVRATAGVLNSEAAEELAAVVFRYWDQAEKADLMRFIRLAADKRDYLVYATRISGEMVLMLAFDTAAPLSQIRPRTRDVARTLASVPPDGQHSARPEPALPQEPAPPPARSTLSAAAADIYTQPYSLELASTETALPKEGDGTIKIDGAIDSDGTIVSGSALDTDDTSDSEGPVIDLAAILGAIPPPDPGRANHGHGTNGANGINGAGFHSPPAAGEAPAGDLFARLNPEQGAGGMEHAAGAGSSAAMPGGWQLADDAAPAAPSTREAEESLPGNTPAPREDDTLPLSTHRGQRGAALPSQPQDVTAPAAGEPPVDPLEDTRPGAITARQKQDMHLPALNMLNYTCVLMPRDAKHFLIGEMADLLAQCVAQSCAAYGWRLEGIAVRPEYLQWSVQVTPTVSPGNLVRILRQRTSQNIFSSFPNLAAHSTAGDFWAPGYLIVSGPQPPSAQLLRDYINQNRGRMGK